MFFKFLQVVDADRPPRFSELLELELTLRPSISTATYRETHKSSPRPGGLDLHEKMPPVLGSEVRVPRQKSAFRIPKKTWIIPSHPAHNYRGLGIARSPRARAIDASRGCASATAPTANMSLSSFATFHTTTPVRPRLENGGKNLALE